MNEESEERNPAAGRNCYVAPDPDLVLHHAAHVTMAAAVPLT